MIVDALLKYFEWEKKHWWKGLAITATISVITSVITTLIVLRFVL